MNCHIHRPFPRMFLSSLHFQFSVLSSELNFICKQSKNYTHLRCLQDIKMLTQQGKGAGTYCSGVDPLSYFSFQPVLHNWCNKVCGICYHACAMMHIKEPLLLIGKSSICVGSGFPFSLSEWSLTICLMPYNRK